MSTVILSAAILWSCSFNPSVTNNTTDEPDASLPDGVVIGDCTAGDMLVEAASQADIAGRAAVTFEYFNTLN